MSVANRCERGAGQQKKKKSHREFTGVFLLLLIAQTNTFEMGPSMVQLVRGLLLESLVRGSNPLVGAPHV